MSLVAVDGFAFLDLIDETNMTQLRSNDGNGQAITDQVIGDPMTIEDNPMEQIGFGYAEPGLSGLGNRNPTVRNDDDDDDSDDDVDHDRPANRCRNCRQPTNSGLVCKRCLTLPRCRASKKYISAEHSPDTDDSRCETCLKQVGKPRVRRAAENSVR